MLFCPKCGSLLKPKKEKQKMVMACSCGYITENTENSKITEKLQKKEQKVEVIEKEVETLPKTEAECPECGHKVAYYWLIQTRASDEPETKFLRCEKCKHVWREYD